MAKNKVTKKGGNKTNQCLLVMKTVSSPGNFPSKEFLERKNNLKIENIS